jgi:hypothetical protein
MSDETKLRNIQISEGTFAQLFKLPQQMIDYLWERIDIAKKNMVCTNKNLAGNISHMYKLEDPQNLVVENLYNILFNPIDNPKMFEFINKEVASVYSRSEFVNKTSGLEPHLDDLWVNFQKKGEFQPIHRHSGTFSFVIWMDIPYHSKDEAKSDHKGNFNFLTASGISREVKPTTIEMSPEMNGYCCFFPSDLAHQVYPFYTSDKDRISISGNILYHSKKPNPPPVYQFPFHMSET